jgi:transmembrane sensor
VHSQATMWFAKLRTRPVSPATVESFQKWQREPAHAVAYEAVERFWSKAGTVADSPVIIAATEAAFQRRSSRIPAWRPTFAVPAALALMLAVGGIGYLALERGSVWRTDRRSGSTLIRS